MTLGCAGRKIIQVPKYQEICYNYLYGTGGSILCDLTHSSSLFFVAHAEKKS